MRGKTRLADSLRICAARLAAALIGGGIFAAPVHAAPPAEPAAGVTVLYNARVFTAEPDRPYAEAVAIRSERILAVGSLAAVDRAAGPAARRIDLHGKFLMPGMIDAHAHPIEGGMTLIQANYPETSDSVPALVQFVGVQLDQQTSLQGDVLVVRGLDLGFWTQAAEIDKHLSSGRFAQQPIVLFGYDGHTAWANRMLRERAGITAAYVRSLPAGERIYYGFDAALEPNGFLVDVAKQKIVESLPKPSDEQNLAFGRAAMRYMNSQGITGWLDPMPNNVIGGVLPARIDAPGYFTAYEALSRHGEMTAHVAAFPVVHADSGLSQIEVVEAFRAKYRDLQNLTIPGLKIFADGVVEIPSQTAALTKPYLNSGRSTPLNCAPDNLNALVVAADRRGLLVHIHAIGDLAVKAGLDAFAAARKANPRSTLPHTMTHLQFVDAEDIPRFAELHVLTALQLLWATADPSTIEQVKPYVDPAIYRTMYPARSLLETGTDIAGASDWPVSSANPFAAIYQAETRSGPQGVLDPAQRMPREAMLYAYTRNSARVLNQLDSIGTIAPGKLADLALIDRDVLTVPAQELKEAAVVWTMLGGRIVYGTGP